MIHKKLLTTIIASLIIFSSVSAKDEYKAYKYLDKLAVKAGTDKSSTFHNYTKIYAKYFEPLRKRKIKVLEIGIFYGNSVKLWENYFEKATLHFIDIDPNLPRYQSESSQYHFVDQSNAKELEDLMGKIGGNFDVIIDDGGHQMDQQITSFKALFPFLKSGGLYIIEDLHTSYWQEYGGYGKVGAPLSGPGTCIDFLKGLIEDLNYTAGVTECADIRKISPEVKSRLNYYQENIESLHFYQSLCVIIKK